MLDAIRRHATGLVAKILFFVLIASFAIWGIGDVFRTPRTNAAVATVGGESIAQNELVRAFDQQYRQAEQRFGGQLTRQQAASLGVMSQALQSLIAQRLLAEHARDLGIGVDDAAVAGEIRSSPIFGGEGGFDRERFNLFLRSNGFTEESLVATVRGDMVRQQLLSAMTDIAAAPPALAQRLYDYRGEKRQGHVLAVAATEQKVPPPDDAQLKTFLDAHAGQYEAPAYRAVTLVAFGPDDLVNDVAVDPAEVRRAYEARVDQFKTPAQRKVEQLLSADEPTAQEAAAMARDGQPFAAVAAAIGGGKVERTELDAIRHGDLPEALDKVVWSLKPGEIGAPVQTPFGWHVVRVLDDQPESQKPFEAVADDLTRDLKREAATGELPKLATRLDDDIAAGTPLDEAARKLNLPVLAVPAVDAKGRDPQDVAVATDRLTPEMLGEIFQAAQGETSLMKDTPDGHYFIFRVDGVTPARPRGVDEVRDKLVEDWTKDAQDGAARAKAEELRARTATPVMLASVAAEAGGVAVHEVGPLKRDDGGYLAGLKPPAVAALFATEPGRVAEGVVPLVDGWGVLAVETVLPVAPGGDELAQLRAQLTDAWRGDLLESYEAALRQRFGVQVNQAALGRLMEAQVQQ